MSHPFTIKELLLFGQRPEGIGLENLDEALGRISRTEGRVALEAMTHVSSKNRAMVALSAAAAGVIDADVERLVWRVPMSRLGIPRNGASRTPAELFPIMAPAFRRSSEK